MCRAHRRSPSRELRHSRPTEPIHSLALLAPELAPRSDLCPEHRRAESELSLIRKQTIAVKKKSLWSASLSWIYVRGCFQLVSCLSLSLCSSITSKRT